MQRLSARASVDALRGVNSFAGCFISATLSRYDGRVEKQLEMRRELEKLAQTV